MEFLRGEGVPNVLGLVSVQCLTRLLFLYHYPKVPSMFRPSFHATTVTLFLHVYCWTLIPSVSAAPLEGHIGGAVVLNHSKDPYTANDFYLNYHSETKTLSWSLSKDGHVVANTTSPLPDNVESVSTSEVFNADLIIVAGLLSNGSGFIRSLNSQGDVLWDVQLKAKIIDLAFNSDGQLVLVTGLTNNNEPLSQTLSASSGEVIRTASPLYSSERRFRRSLLQATPNTTDDDNILIPKEEERAFMVLEWLLGLVGLVETTLVVAGLVGAGFAINGYYKANREAKEERISRAKEKELSRREEERSSLLKFNKFKPLRDLFGYRPFISPGGFSGVASFDGFVNPPDETGRSCVSLTPVTLPCPSPTDTQEAWLIEEESKQEEALFAAAQKGNIYDVKKILSTYPDFIDRTDENGNSILHFAVAMKHLPTKELVEFIQFLLSLGARIDTSNSQGLSPILLAAQTKSTEPLAILLRNPNISFSTRSMLFHITAQSRDSVRSCFGFGILLQLGLHRGINFNRLRDQELLSDNVISSVSVGGLTILHEAAISENFDAIELILEHDLVNVDEIDDSGNTALHYAVLHTKKSSLTIGKLLEKGADILAVNSFGATPIANAIFKKDPLVASLLLDYAKHQGLDPKDIDGMELAELARIAHSR